MMKKTLSLASVSACCAAISLLFGGLAEVCFGRIGESREQIVERYGEPKLEEADKTKIPGAMERGFDRQLSFLHNNTIVIVKMQKGESVAEQFIFLRAAKPAPITDATLGSVEAILESSSGGQKWVRLPPDLSPDDMNYFWSCKEGDTVAYVRRDVPTTLVIEGTSK